MPSHPRQTYLSLLAVVLVAALVGAVFALGTAAQPAAVRTPSRAPRDAAKGTQRPGEEPMHTSDVQVTGDEIAIIKTDKGVIQFEFYPNDAPNTVATFIELARKGFYDGITFHRVVPGFVVQGGDPQTKDPSVSPQLHGTGGPGFRLKAEFNRRPHLEGTVAMARSADPDSAGSQFYICLAPQPGLDGQYTVFGQVTEGMDVVKQIAQGDVMESVRIESSK